MQLKYPVPRLGSHHITQTVIGRLKPPVLIDLEDFWNHVVGILGYQNHYRDCPDQQIGLKMYHCQGFFWSTTPTCLFDLETFKGIHSYKQINTKNHSNPLIICNTACLNIFLPIFWRIFIWWKNPPKCCTRRSANPVVDHKPSSKRKCMVSCPHKN